MALSSFRVVDGCNSSSDPRGWYREGEKFHVRVSKKLFCLSGHCPVTLSSIICSFVNISHLNPEVRHCWVRRLHVQPFTNLHYILSYKQVYCYPPLWQLHTDFVNFNNGVC